MTKNTGNGVHLTYTAQRPGRTGPENPPEERSGGKAVVIGLTSGIAGLLLMGTGLTCILRWNLFVSGILTGMLGIAGIVAAWPVYQRIQNRNQEEEKADSNPMKTEEEMKMSKIMEANKKVEQGVVKGYKAIENGVVGGYQAIENGVVSGFNKISDKFVDTFLTREGETVEEAKARLAAEQKAREARSFGEQTRTEQEGE